MRKIITIFDNFNKEAYLIMSFIFLIMYFIFLEKEILFAVLLFFLRYVFDKPLMKRLSLF